MAVGALGLGGCDEGDKSPSTSENSSLDEDDTSKGSDKGKPKEKKKDSGKSDKGNDKGNDDSTKDSGKDSGKNDKSKGDSTKEDDKTKDSGDSTKEDDKKDSSDKNGDSTEKDDSQKGEPIACEGDSPTVVLETSMGRIVLGLDKRAPNTVANFIQYVNDKHYDSTLFHRVIPGFMIQGGGWDLKGKEKKTRAPIKLEIHPELRHKAGALAMARTSVRDSATAQFYICDTDRGCKGLDDDYAVFGFASEGIDVVKAIAKVPRSSSDKPNEDVVLNKAYCIKSE